MLNQVVLIGRLTKDPELRYTPSGKAVAGMRLAVDRGTSNPQGERETDFIDIVVWDKQAETCANYLNKGRLVAVTGRLQIRQYDAQDGTRRTVAEVVANQVRFLDRGDNSGGGGAGPGASGGRASGGYGGGGGGGGFAGAGGGGRESGLGTDMSLDDDDDVPF